MAYRVRTSKNKMVFRITNGVEVSTDEFLSARNSSDTYFAIKTKKDIIVGNWEDGTFYCLCQNRTYDINDVDTAPYLFTSCKYKYNEIDKNWSDIRKVDKSVYDRMSNQYEELRYKLEYDYIYGCHYDENDKYIDELMSES